MPQIQILPRAPSFGNRLAPILSQAVGDIGEGFAERNANLKDEKVIEDFSKKENPSPMDYINHFSKLSRKSQKAYEPLFSQILKTQGISNIEKGKEQKQQLEDKEQQDEWKRLFEGLEKRIPYTGMANIPFTKSMLANFPWSKAKEEREYFDVLAFQLERYARAAHTKGALSTKVYESLLSKLPNAEFSEAKNRGRINAWKEVLNKPGVPEELLPAEKKSGNSEGKWLISPSGKKVFIPTDQVENALSSGGKLA